jgi:hypothetical protein
MTEERVKPLNALRVEFWWKLKCWAGKVWRRYSNGRASFWLDWLPALFARKRYAAERRARPWLFHPEPKKFLGFVVKKTHKL